MIAHFDHVYIVLDALDECKSEEQTALLDFVETIVAQKLGRLHLLITSRRLPNIEEALTPLVNGQISLEVAINEDIRIYIRDTLKNDRFLKRFKETEKEMI